MPSDLPLCPKCQGHMFRGTVGHRVGAVPFNSGAPSIFTDNITPQDLTASPRSLAGKNTYAITAHRCQKCGYLELYADEENKR